MEVIGADKLVAGKVTDVWIDKPDATIRYFEVELTGLATPRRVLLPVPFAVLKNSQRKILVSSILASQFAHVPGTKEPESVTLLEEDKIMAYFGGGTLYATPGRQEPLL
jgi:photosynthetic reaction center H subunit